MTMPTSLRSPSESSTLAAVTDRRSLFNQLCNRRIRLGWELRSRSPNRQRVAALRAEIWALEAACSEPDR